MFDNNIINNPMIPFETPTPGGFAPNAEVIIHGRSEKGKHGFVIEFGAGNDVALHMSFRYKSEEKLVMNTAINGDWQKEERHKNPVFHEHSFEIKVQCKPTEFIIWQKHHKFEFGHRMDPMLINSLRINGEVSIELIKFERFGQGSTPYANAYNPTAPPPNQYPSGGPYGDISYQPHIGGGTYGGPSPNIGGGTYGMPSYNDQNPSGIGFGASPTPNIGYGSTPAPNAGGGYYPNLNDTPNPNSGYPSMHPNPNQF
uniref:Galectin n=1 Tax=Panagrolaimus sp. PS1159 TaxID=55785 RepID=A0AC35ES36_9BILA